MKSRRGKKMAGLTFLTFLALGLLVSLTLVATSPQARTNSGNTLKIALNVPTSGPGASFGTPPVYTYKAIAAQLNSKGGLLVAGKRYKVVILVDDNKWDPTTTRSAAVKRVSEGVKFIMSIGDPSDPLIAPVTEKAKVILVDWTGNKYLLSAPNHYATDTFISPNIEGVQYYRFLRKREPNIKTVYHVGIDLQFDKNNSKWEHQAATAVGLKWLGDVFYQPGTVDFSSALAPAVNAHPDLVALGSTGGDTAALIKTLRDLGFKGVISSAVTAQSLEDIVKGAGAKADGYYQAELFGYPPAASLAAFKKLYEAQSGGSWSTIATNIWVQANFLLKAIQRAGTIDNTDKILAAWEHTSLKDPFLPGSPTARPGGKKTYGQVRALAIPVAVNRYLKGRFVTLTVLRISIP